MSSRAKFRDVSAPTASTAGDVVFRVGHPGTFEWLTAGELRVDRSYQRGVNQQRVQELVKDWHDDAFGNLQVSRRKDGDYIIDGQHRREGVIAMGLNSAVVPCFVMTDLTREEEADIFWRLNKKRLQPGSADTFRARLAAKEPVAQQIEELCRKHDVTVMYYPAALKANEVYALGAMERIHEMGDLDWVLQTIRAGWPEDPAALRQDRLLGIQRFRTTFKGLLSDGYPEGRARYEHLIRQMQQYHPNVVADKALEFRTTLHSRPNTAFARALHFFYNYKIKNPALKLPHWPTTAAEQRLPE